MEAEEVKLLTAENAVLTEENNKLKVYAERKQPKFWFGDRVRVGDVITEFEIVEIALEYDIFYYSESCSERFSEYMLELADENISK